MARPEVGLGSKCGSRRAEGAEGGKRGTNPRTRPRLRKTQMCSEWRGWDEFREDWGPGRLCFVDDYRISAFV